MEGAVTMSKPIAKSATDQNIPPVYFYGAIVTGIIVLCLISWAVYSSHNTTASVDTVNAREAAKQVQNGPSH